MSRETEDKALYDALTEQLKQMGLPDTPAVRVSVSLQGMAGVIADMLQAATGKPDIGFSLFVWTDGVSSYISNSARPDVAVAVTDILARWKAGQDDTPIHKVTEGPQNGEEEQEG